MDLDVIRISVVEVNTGMDEMQDATSKEQLTEAYEEAQESLLSVFYACKAKFE